MNVLLRRIANSNNFFNPAHWYPLFFYLLSSSFVLFRHKNSFIIHGHSEIHFAELECLLQHRVTDAQVYCRVGLHNTELLNVMYTYTTTLKIFSYSNQCSLLCSQLNPMHIRPTVFTTLSYRTLLSCEKPWVTELYVYYRINNTELLNSIAVLTPMSYWPLYLKPC